MPHLPLITSASKLHQALSESPEALLILDIREKEEYNKLHIPSAQWFDKQAVNTSHEKTSGLLPRLEDLYSALLKSGYSKQKHIVVYNTNCNPIAGRVVWTLYAFGMTNISLLDGGFDYWQQCNLPTSNITTKLETPVNFSSKDLSLPSKQIACDHTDILAKLQKPNIAIIDARTPAEYSGEDVRSTHGGHIPKAVNINWTETLTENGLFKKESELNRLLEAQDINKDSQIITYCQSHQRSALLAILLMHLAYPHVTGYPGAWSDWGNREDTPKEK